MSDTSHDHDHGAVGSATALGVAILLNLVITASEAGVGFHAGSLALVADALHNLSDVGGLVLAWVGARLALRAATATRTFGLLRAEPLVGFVNGLVLLPLAGTLIWTGVQRLGSAAAPPGPVVMVLGVVALIANTGSALLLRPHAASDLGTRSAVLHLLTDAAASAAVILGGILIWLGVPHVDPILSIGIGLLSAWAAFGIVRDAAHVLAEGAPAGASADEVAASLRSVPGVLDVHHVHVWSVSTRLRAASAHLVVQDAALSAAAGLVRLAQERLHVGHDIDHATLQLEVVACEGTGVLADPRASAQH
jgi:cobalt-zinc-cadmium efflux system protein